MVVVDTHILIWDALAPRRLSEPAKEAIAQANEEDGLLICDISLWEIAMLVRKGRIQVETDSQSLINLILEANSCTIQPITAQIAALSADLPSPINADPADRLILATAVVGNLPLITADRNLQATKLVPIIW